MGPVPGPAPAPPPPQSWPRTPLRFLPSKSRRGGQYQCRKKSGHAVGIHTNKSASASRPSNRSARVCADTSAPSPAQGQRRRRALRPCTDGKPLVRHFETIEELRLAFCSISPPGTPTGWSPAMATGHLLRSKLTSSRPWVRPHERCSHLQRGAVQNGAKAAFHSLIGWLLVVMVSWRGSPP